MHCTTICPIWLYHISPHISYMAWFFFGGGIEYKMCIFIFSTNFVCNISHSNKSWAWYYHKCTQVFMWNMLFLYETWIFPTDFQKNTPISNYIKICPVGAQLFHEDGWMDGRADRQADMLKLIVAFRNFANTPKKNELLKVSYESVTVNWQFPQYNYYLRSLKYTAVSYVDPDELRHDFFLIPFCLLEYYETDC